MADRIDKFDPNAGVYRVQETRDSLEEEQQNQGGDEGDENRDSFDRLSEKTDWNLLFEQQNLWKKNIEIPVEEIASIKFLGINIKTDPSLLNIRVALNDGQVLTQAFLPIARMQGFKFKSTPRLSDLNIKQITSGPILNVTTPVDEDELNKEITKITRKPKTGEVTFSQRMKNLIHRKSLIQKIGLQDPVSKSVNNEIVGIYVTILVVVITVIFGIYILL